MRGWGRGVVLEYEGGGYLVRTCISNPIVIANKQVGYRRYSLCAGSSVNTRGYSHDLNK